MGPNGNLVLGVIASCCFIFLMAGLFGPPGLIFGMTAASFVTVYFISKVQQHTRKKEKEEAK